MVSVNEETKSSETVNNHDATAVDTDPKQASNAVNNGTLTAPSGCAHRNAVDDGALAAASLAVHLRSMDAQVVKDLVRAREMAASVKLSFPGGDERFAEMSDSEGEEIEVEEDNEESDPCIGLYDDKVDPNAHACIERAKDVSGFDLLEEMRRLSMPFLARIRTINRIRKFVRDDGVKVADVVVRIKELMNNKTSDVWTNDELLQPAVTGDVLLTILDDDDDNEEEGENAKEMLIAESVNSVMNKQ